MTCPTIFDYETKSFIVVLVLILTYSIVHLKYQPQKKFVFPLKRFIFKGLLKLYRTIFLFLLYDSATQHNILKYSNGQNYWEVKFDCSEKLLVFAYKHIREWLNDSWSSLWEYLTKIYQKGIWYILYFWLLFFH